jgi:transcriptional regulator with XRE-family HTH domain
MQEELAIVSGLSTRTIQRIERGQDASLETLKALAAAFEVDLSALKDPDMFDASTMAAGDPMPETPVQPERTARADELLAFEHVRQIRRFYFQIVAYVVVCSALAVVNYLYSPRFIWVVFPALFWGLGIVLRGLRTFAHWPWGPEWEKRQVEKYLGRKL